MKAGVFIKEITFSGSQKIAVDKNDIVVIVGPNNAGKSVTLKALNEFVKNAKYKNPVVSAVDITSEGDRKSVV